MKIKRKHQDLYRFYLRVGLRNKEGIFFGRNAMTIPEVGDASAMEAYHTYESTGKMIPCASPLLFKTIESGKAIAKLTIDSWMSDLEVGDILTKGEVLEYIEEWPQSERNNVITRMKKIVPGLKAKESFRF